MIIIGVDEAGRGAWAGPLVAAAVVLHRPLDGLTDSKKLTSKQREQLSSLIRQQAAVGTGWVNSETIDTVGLTHATTLAMTAAVNELMLDFRQPLSIIVDGNINYLSRLAGSSCLVRADASVAEVSAASIIAKTVRDEYMKSIAANYPQYGFDRHVGYGTAYHQQKLRQYGLCDHHRKSYRPVAAAIKIAHD